MNDGLVFFNYGKVQYNYYEIRQNTTGFVYSNGGSNGGQAGLFFACMVGMLNITMVICF